MGQALIPRTHHKYDHNEGITLAAKQPHRKKYENATEREYDRARLAGEARVSLDALITQDKPHADPLLNRLQGAIKPDGDGGKDGGVPDASQKNVMSLEAFEMMDDVRQYVEERLELLATGAAPRGLLAFRLQALLDLAVKNQDAELRSLKAVAKRYASWSSQITEFLDPTAIKFEVKGPCSDCGIAEVLVREDGMTSKKIAKWEADGKPIPETKMLIKGSLHVHGETLKCRHCLMEIVGLEGMRAHEARRAGTVVSLDAERKRLEELSQIADEAETARWAA